MNPFHRIVCDAEAVRTAFSGYPLLQFWWSLILFFHGKPTDLDYSESERIPIIAGGFRFYALLYGLLGLLIVVSGMAMHFAGQSLYVALGMGFSGLLLLVFAQFGYCASNDFESQKSGAQLSLLLFMVCLMLFLTGFLCLASLVINEMGIVAPIVNLSITGVLLIIGVGSYFIELIFLTAPFSFTKSSCINDNISIN